MATTKKTQTKTEDTAAKMADGAQKGFEAMADLFMVPKLDMSAAGDFHRKNMEAATEAGKILFDGSKAVAAKQVELSRDYVQEMTDMASGASKAKDDTSPMVGFEFFQAAAQKNMASMREIADIAFDANQKAFAVMQTRYTECLSEVQGEAG